MKNFFKIIFAIILIFSTIFSIGNASEEKIKIGLLIPMTGENKDLGDLLIKSTRMALKDINNIKLEIFPKDTASNPKQVLKSAAELKEMGVKIVIGPIFYENISYLEEIQDMIFISLTNKTLNLPRNVISSGVNATSQLRTIKKFLELNDVKKTIFLTPKLNYELEIKKALKKSKIKISKHYVYDTEPTKLTSQIEKITNYKIRKQNLEDEIRRVENSDLVDKEKQLYIGSIVSGLFKFNILDKTFTNIKSDQGLLSNNVYDLPKEGNPDYSIAFKINQYGKLTQITNIEWNVSKHGQLVPTLVFEPIILGNSRVSKCTGYHGAYIFTNKLGPGAIIILYSFPNLSRINLINSLKYGHLLIDRCGEQKGNNKIYFLRSN